MQQILDHLDFLDHTIDTLTAQVVARTRVFAEQVELLAEVPGLDQTTIQVILAETGGDMARFPAPRTWPPGRGCAPATMSQLHYVFVGDLWCCLVPLCTVVARCAC
jgi:transposase